MITRGDSVVKIVSRNQIRIPRRLRHIKFVLNFKDCVLSSNSLRNPKILPETKSSFNEIDILALRRGFFDRDNGTKYMHGPALR